MKNLKLQISEDELEFFSSHLEELNSDIDRRPNDVFQINVLNWIIAPFEADLFEINVELQESFSELKTDLELKVNFSKARYENF